MRRNTAQFLSRLRRNKSVRESIALQMNENRYYAFAQQISKEDPKIVEMAENSEFYALTYYLYRNQAVLDLPQRLSLDGCRRLARTLIQM